MEEIQFRKFAINYARKLHDHKVLFNRRIDRFLLPSFVAIIFEKLKKWYKCCSNVLRDILIVKQIRRKEKDTLEKYMRDIYS